MRNEGDSVVVSIVVFGFFGSE